MECTAAIQIISGIYRNGLPLKVCNFIATNLRYLLRLKNTSIVDKMIIRIVWEVKFREPHGS